MATIALVDDDRNILTSVSIALESEGYRVETYTDGASALEGLSARPPNLAIFDIKMPRMDGMELLRRLRQKSDIPVIFLTSKDDEIDELFGLKMGADDFIKKPFSQRLLVERVRAVLAGRLHRNRDAGAVDEDAGVAQLVGDLREGGLGALLARHVAFDGDAAEILRHRLGALDADVEQRDLRALGGKRARRRLAETGAAAGDDRDLT